MDAPKGRARKTERNVSYQLASAQLHFARAEYAISRCQNQVYAYAYPEDLSFLLNGDVVVVDEHDLCSRKAVSAVLVDLLPGRSLRLGVAAEPVPLARTTASDNVSTHGHERGGGTLTSLSL